MNAAERIVSNMTKAQVALAILKMDVAYRMVHELYPRDEELASRVLTNHRRMELIRMAAADGLSLEDRP